MLNQISTGTVLWVAVGSCKVSKVCVRGTMPRVCLYEASVYCFAWLHKQTGQGGKCMSSTVSSRRQEPAQWGNKV